VTSSNEAVQRRLLDALKDVEDPEIPISIVDMGLVVNLEVVERRVQVQMTLTAMGCPAVDMIMDDVRECLGREPGIEGVDIEIVWSPIWTKDRVSEEGKASMRELGISI